MALILQKTNVNAVVDSYIKESKYKGNYYADKKYYFLKINSIKKDRVSGYVDASNVSRELSAYFTTNNIKDNKATFKYKDNWDNTGKGTIIFNKDGTINMTVKTTKNGSYSRASFYFENFTFSKKKPKKSETSKLSNGIYFTHHTGNSNNLEYDLACCKRARIKNGKITIWGSLDKRSCKGNLVVTKKYAKRVLLMSKSCDIYGLSDGGNGDDIKERFKKSEFNKWFDNTKGTIDFMITVKNNKVTEIQVCI